MSIEIAGVAASAAQTSAIRSDLGLGNVDNTSDSNKPVSTAQANAIAGVTKASLGMGAVDNTSDANKPVSTAQATANALALPKAGGIMTGPIVLAGPATLATHPITKQQFDDQLQGLKSKGNARLRTVAALPACTYVNGAAGVGATLTGNAVGALSVDATAVAVGDVIAVGDEVSQLTNGLYVVTTPGNAGAVFVLTRASNMDIAAEFAGAFIIVTEGATKAGAAYYATFTGSFVVGGTAFTWTQNSSVLASTDALSEGATNKYFTVSRVLAAIVTGFSTASAAVVDAAADTVLSALGKLQAQVTLRALAAAPVLTGIVTHAGADLIVGTPVVGNVVDLTVGKNTLTLTSAVTLTFGGSPATGQSTTLYVTGDTVARVITLPTNVRSALQQVIIASFTVPANWSGRLFLEKTAVGFDIDGEPVALANKGVSGRFGTGANDTQVITLTSPIGGTITNFITQSASGTATYQLVINAVNVTGGSNAVSTTFVNNAPTALNIIVVGDKISIIRTADATCVNADFSLYIAPAKL